MRMELHRTNVNIYICFYICQRQHNQHPYNIHTTSIPLVHCAQRPLHTNTWCHSCHPSEELSRTLLPRIVPRFSVIFFNQGTVKLVSRDMWFMWKFMEKHGKTSTNSPVWISLDQFRSELHVYITWNSMKFQFFSLSLVHESNLVVHESSRHFGQLSMDWFKGKS